MARSLIRCACAAAAICLAAVVVPAWGQRVEFPTQLTQLPADPGAPVAPAISGGVVQPTAPGWDPYAAQGLPPGTTFAAPPGYPAPGAAPYPYAPAPGPAYAAPGPYAAPPYAAPQPYYTPNPTTPGYLYPDGAPAVAPGYQFGNPWETINGYTRFMQEFRLQETYIYDSGDRKVSVNDIETSATFAIPTSFTRNPFFLTPGFALHLWQGPGPPGSNGADLPPQTYDAFLDTAWDPQLTPFFGADLGVRVGVYSDFHTFDTHSIRIMGRGLGVISYSPEMQFKLGIVYIDRNDIKLLPAGGIFYTPNPDTRWEIFFPRPKFTQRFATTGTYQWWWYVTGEYGGGAWTIQRANGNSDDFDYNDIRTSVGVEWIPETTTAAFRGYAEIGGAFDRELVYRFNPPQNLDLRNTFFLRAGLMY